MEGESQQDAMQLGLLKYILIQASEHSIPLEQKDVSFDQSESSLDFNHGSKMHLAYPNRGSSFHETNRHHLRGEC